jgi:hypothetical protein
MFRVFLRECGSDLLPALKDGASSRLFLHYVTPPLARTGAFRRARRALSALRGSCFHDQTRSLHAAPLGCVEGGYGGLDLHRREFGVAPPYSDSKFRRRFIYFSGRERSVKVIYKVYKGGGFHPLRKRRELPAVEVKSSDEQMLLVCR